MHYLRAGLLTLLWLALLPAIGRAAEPVPLPALTTRVTDLTATLDATQRGRLEAQLAAIERSGRAQIAVLLLPTTQPETIEQFGIRLAEAWKIGRKGADNGLIVIVAKADRTMRIEVGYGLEGAIPDVIAKRIIAERMTPAFKQGDFFGGLQAAVAALDQAIGGSAPGAPGAPAAPLPASTNPGADQAELFPWLMGAAVAGGVLRSLFGLFGALLAGVIAGGLGFLIFGSVLAAGIAGVLVFVFSFFNLMSRGGGFGGGGGFSGGGGGFSGGGGGFGGGGASGRW